MTQNNINDMAIAREAQLMFNYMREFKPIGNELNRWQGEIILITDQGEKKLPIEIFIPLKYPEYPPKVIVLEKNIQHPNVEKNGSVLLRMTHDWKSDIHVYQVVQALFDLFKKVPPIFTNAEGSKTLKQKPSVESIAIPITENQRKVDDINQEITDLQLKIKAKDEEIQKLQEELVKDPNEALTKIDDLELMLPKDREKGQRLLLQAKNVALADLISTLDEKFKDGEISPIDFAKLYRKYTKELYMVQKELESS